MPWTALVTGAFPSSGLRFWRAAGGAVHPSVHLPAALDQRLDRRSTDTGVLVVEHPVPVDDPSLESSPVRAVSRIETSAGHHVAEPVNCLAEARFDVVRYIAERIRHVR